MNLIRVAAIIAVLGAASLWVKYVFKLFASGAHFWGVAAVILTLALVITKILPRK